MSSRLKEIMQLKKSENDNEDREIQLRKYAKEIGVSSQKTYDSDGRHNEKELVDRIRQAEAIIENKKIPLWQIIVGISAILGTIVAIIKLITDVL